MLKALFNIGFTTPKPPANLHGQKRADYMSRRKFYNLTAPYNFFTYSLSNKKVVKNKNAEEYFTRGGTNSGLFDTNGALDKEQIDEIKKNLASTQSIIWHGFISFDDETSLGFNTQENAIKFLNQTFNAFIDSTHLKRDNICLYASLHEDTDHRHIHFSFFEKEPQRRNKEGELCYTLKGKVEPKAIDNYLVSMNMHLDEHGEEYYTARNVAMASLNETRHNVANGIIRNQMLNIEIRRLISSLPKKGRLQYRAENMALLRPQIDKIAGMLIASDLKASQAHKEMLRQLATVEKNVNQLVKDNKLAYVDGKRRLSKEEISAIMRSGDENKIIEGKITQGVFTAEELRVLITGERPEKVKKFAKDEKIKITDDLIITLPIESKLKEYGKATMFRMPDDIGEFAGSALLVPTGFIKTNANTVEITTPAQYEFTLKKKQQDIQINQVDLNNINYFERLKEDYQARVGNVVLGLCKDIKCGDIRNSKRGDVNDKDLKIAAKRERVNRNEVVKKVIKLLSTLSYGEKADFLKSVQEIESEQEYQKKDNG